MNDNTLKNICHDMLTFLESRGIINLNIRTVFIYYHWTIDEYVIEIDNKFVAYCSDIDYYNEPKIKAKVRKKMKQ